MLVFSRTKCVHHSGFANILVNQKERPAFPSLLLAPLSIDTIKSQHRTEEPWFSGLADDCGLG